MSLVDNPLDSIPNSKVLSTSGYSQGHGERTKFTGGGFLSEGRDSDNERPRRHWLLGNSNRNSALQLRTLYYCIVPATTGTTTTCVNFGSSIEQFAIFKRWVRSSGDASNIWISTLLRTQQA